MGRGLHTVLVRCRAPPPSLVRALPRRAGVGSPFGRDPRGSRRLEALGRAVCRSSRTPPPPRRGPVLGRGGAPSAPGGGGSLLWLPSWGGGSGGGAGGPPPRPPPRRASATHLLSMACPPAVYSCRGGCRAAAGVGRGPVGRQRISTAGGGGKGGGTPPALVRAPVFSGPASERAAPFAPSWAPPVHRGPAAGSACGRLPRPWCPRTPGAVASFGGVWGRRLFRLPQSALGPERDGGGGVGGGLWSPGAAS